MAAPNKVPVADVTANSFEFIEINIEESLNSASECPVCVPCALLLHKKSSVEHSMRAQRTLKMHEPMPPLAAPNISISSYTQINYLDISIQLLSQWNAMWNETSEFEHAAKPRAFAHANWLLQTNQ